MISPIVDHSMQSVTKGNDDNNNTTNNNNNNNNNGETTKSQNYMEAKELFWDAEGPLAPEEVIITDFLKQNDENVWMDMMVLFVAMVQTAIVDMALSCHHHLERVGDFTIDACDRIGQSFVTICCSLPETILRMVFGEERAEEILDAVDQFQFDVRNHRLVRAILTGDDDEDFFVEEETDAADYIDHVDFVHRVRYERVQLDR
eukprot:CAMPEP_0117044280 /NCGR_PEP_ID=MMETSP0472-20121206/30705_1 /TAXON_ID=693140 ORGANISM="Tiarina fusus, Strain LIS" /NCGR_SAMPLE_ID=MMETSP0472 /ASSEMBLY_ACC=CAM_ASM_000603 /LENGTH=202 /DNA_ID=CAMNT_0004755981 /DNA_START=192 /DNA_END=803 /DNA_ORIENTATION=-